MSIAHLESMSGDDTITIEMIVYLLFRKKYAPAHTFFESYPSKMRSASTNRTTPSWENIIRLEGNEYRLGRCDSRIWERSCETVTPKIKV